MGVDSPRADTKAGIGVSGYCGCHVTKRLTALFEQFKQHQTKPAILKDIYIELKDCFQPEYWAEVQAAFELLTGLQY